MYKFLTILGAGTLVAGRNFFSGSWIEHEGDDPIVPTKDPFYDFSHNVTLQNLAKGDVIRQRRAYYSNLTNLDRAYQLLYRSEDTFGEPTVSVTTVFIPTGNDNKNILSYQVFEDSASINCAPSYGLFNVTDQNIQQGLKNGWVVNTPDYEGHNASFTAGVLAGKLTLDSAKAVLNSKDAMGIQNEQVVLWGYSGGATPTAWSAQLHDTYAPEVKILAAVVGGVAINTAESGQLINKTPYAGLLPAGLFGIASEYTQLWDLYHTYLKPEKYSSVYDVLKNCLNDNYAEFKNQDIYGWFTNGVGILSEPLFKEISANNTLGATAPTMPVYMYQGQFDQFTPIAAVDKLALQYCNSGTPLLYQKSLTDHINAYYAFETLAFDYVREIFAGARTKGCRFLQGPTGGGQASPLSQSSSNGSLEALVGALTDTVGSVTNGLLTGI